MIFPLLLAIGGVLDPDLALPWRRIIELLGLLTKELASETGNNLILFFWTEKSTLPIMGGEKAQLM